MSWHMHDDLTGDRIADPAKSGALTVVLDNDVVAAFDVDPTVYTRESLLAALGEHLAFDDVARIRDDNRPLDPGPLDAPADPSPAVPPVRGEADAPAPDPAGEGRAPAAASNGHPVDLDRFVDGGHGDGVGPHRSDDAPVASPEREPDWAARAEDLLDSKWTPKQVAEELHVELADVRALMGRTRGPKGGKR